MKYKEISERFLVCIPEKKIHEYFKTHFKKYGFEKIKDIDKNGDFIGWKKKKPYRIEIEKKTRDFLLHGHEIEKVNFVFVLIDDGSIKEKKKIRTLNKKHFLEWLKLDNQEKEKRINSMTITSKIKLFNRRLFIPIPRETEGCFFPDMLVEARIKKLESTKEAGKVF